MKEFLRKSKVMKVFAGLVISMQLTSIGFAAPIMPGDQEDQNRRARQEALDKQQRERQSDVFLQKRR